MVRLARARIGMEQHVLAGAESAELGLGDIDSRPNRPDQRQREDRRPRRQNRAGFGGARQNDAVGRRKKDSISEPLLGRREQRHGAGVIGLTLRDLLVAVTTRELL